jgi:hypothetical protein
VFNPTGAWTTGRAIDPEVFPVGDQLLLYFATRDPDMRIQMLGVAGVDLKSGFGREYWKQLRDAPILKPKLPWGKLCIEATPSVIGAKSSSCSMRAATTTIHSKSESPPVVTA